jgi:hypothetical protein
VTKYINARDSGDSPSALLRAFSGLANVDMVEGWGCPAAIYSCIPAAKNRKTRISSQIHGTTTTNVRSDNPGRKSRKIAEHRCPMG